MQIITLQEQVRNPRRKKNILKQKGKKSESKKCSRSAMNAHGLDPVGTLRSGYPTYKHQDNDSCLLTGGSSEAATCPHDSDSCLPAQASSGATTCPHDSDSCLPAQASSGAATCLEDGFCRPQANKQTPHSDLAIMISIVTCTRISFKTLRDNGCFTRSQGVKQVTHYCRRDIWQACHSALLQCRVVQQLWATGRLQLCASAVGHLSATVTGLVTQRHSPVPMTECRVADDMTRRAHAVENIVDYS
jgi:hypothetical protein